MLLGSSRLYLVLQFILKGILVIKLVLFYWICFASEWMSKALLHILQWCFFLLPCNGTIVWYKAVILYLLIIISTEYERLSDRRFCALKYNIVLQGFIFSSGGFCVCCSIVILFIYKVLLDKRLKPFTVMLLLWCSV